MSYFNDDDHKPSRYHTKCTGEIEKSEKVLPWLDMKRSDLQMKEIATLIRQTRRNQLLKMINTTNSEANCYIPKIRNLINQIPDEVYTIHIFPYLKVESLAGKCSLVCKKWFSNVQLAHVSINNFDKLGWKREKHLSNIVKSFKCLESLVAFHGGNEDYSLIRFLSENATSLRKLELSGNSFNQGHIVTRYITNGKLNNLEELAFKDYELEERGILHLTKHESCLKNLTSLEISDKNIGKHLAHLSVLENLKSLTISYCISDEKVIETLCNGLKNLEKLSLSFNTPTVDPKCFKHIANLSNLKYFHTTSMSNESAQYLSSGKLTNLKTLSLLFVTMEEGVLESLFSGNLNEITCLHLKYCTFASMKPIATNLHSLTTLEISTGNDSPLLLHELSVANCKLLNFQCYAHSGFTPLYNFNSPTFSSLKVLNLSQTSSIGNQLNELLQGKLIHLQDLNLKLTGITDEDLKSIRNAINQTPETEEQSFGQLTRLNLSLNKIGDEGCRYLSECRGLYNLRKLQLKNNRIGEEGSKYLIVFALARPKFTNLQGYSLLANDDD
ncbi:predicted protein [Naegleria gruberi]|uniref:Predicted protein n=1 Tax=Naegleria gruberi TaxID=5762 RepID=D2VSW4_NAEGR|nr:uncharacterized protein NAEGRDRAFT_72084 [Naegleria gruberi]EFC39971.1 predicted protein [Naegleria gruberi]|eukprot:XP_002672715.1 predicted protein [Naegleria gruberi strain NEG-M]